MIPMQQLPDDPVRVIVESTGGPEWWEIFASLGPLGILTAAVITGVIGWRSLRHSRTALIQKIDADDRTLEQKRLADLKAQWWDRVQWALDASFSADPERRRAGIAMLNVLGEADGLTKDEIMLLDAAWQEPLDEVEPNGDDGWYRAEDVGVQDASDGRSP